MADDLTALLDRWLKDELEEAPERASSLGIDGYDERLTDFSAAGVARRAARDARWIAELESIGDEGMSLDDRIDRDLVLSTLRGRQLMESWEVWRRDPGTYLSSCLGSVFILFLHRLHEEADLARFAGARMRAMPGVVADAKANLDPELASPIFVERAIGQCRAAIAYCQDLVPAEVSDAGVRAPLAEAGQVAASAFEDFLAFLQDLHGKATGHYAIGEERYSALLQQKEGLGYGAVGLRERGQAAYDELAVEMSALAAQITGKDDWRAALESFNQDHPSSPEEMREEYERWTEAARQFLIDNELVTMPEGERCLVVPSPPFQRPVLAVASYMAPPAFRPSVTGHFNVPFPPDGTSAEEIQKRLETNSRSSIPTVAVHEAYPGHHWHLVWMQQQPRPIRKVIGTPYFTEGWALYAERLMREHGFFTDPRQELAHLDARIFRAARIVVDTSLHLGDMTFDEAVEFMTTKASLSEPTAKAEVGRYCTWPTQASSYLTGSIEIERIRERYLAEVRGSVREFNDAIAGSGMLPLALAERAVLGA